MPDVVGVERRLRQVRVELDELASHLFRRTWPAQEAARYEALSVIENDLVELLRPR